MTTSLFNNYGRLPIDLVDGHDWFLVDDTGHEYLDFTSGIGVCSLGYSNGPVVKAVTQQVGRVWHTSNLYDSALQEEVAALLTAPDQLAFFCNSGTEANEAAFKLARKATGRTQVLAFNNGFHGRTYGSMSLTGNPDIQAGYAPLVPDVTFADYNSPDVLTAIGPHLAAVILEVIQGEGGVIPADTKWLQAVGAECKRQGVLLIVDEVQTGIGRTGTKFAYMAAGLDPDIVTVAKALGNGLPIGAMLGKTALGDAFGPGAHGSTFGGNKVALAAARAVLQQLTPTMLAGVRSKADTLWNELDTAVANLSVVTGVTGRGLMVGIHLKAELPVNTVLAKLRQQGMLALSAKHNTLRLLPPLIMSEADLERGVDMIRNAIMFATND